MSHLISILLFIFVCRNNGFNTLELFKIGLIFPISLLFSTLPISIGGWGIREGSLFFLSSSLGLDAQNIILSSVQFGIILAISGLSNSIFIIPLSKIMKNKQN